MQSPNRFDELLQESEPRLRRAFIAAYGLDRAADATAEAVAWGWEHQDQLLTMENPVGYLYRVGQSRTRQRKPLELPPPQHIGVPEVEPRLIQSMNALPEMQKVCMWLVHGCEWTHREVAEALEIGTSTVSTHVSRALTNLRNALDVNNG